MIPLSEIEQMRNVFASLFDRVVDIKRKTHQSDGAGSWTTQEDNLGSFSCYIRPDREASKKEKVAATAETLRQTYWITFEYDVDVRKGDLIEADEGVLEILEIHKDGSTSLCIEVLAGVIQ